MIIALACLFLSVSQLGVSADRADDSARSELEFDFGLFHTLVADHHGENFVLCPTSLYDCLLDVYVAAGGKTDKGLEIILGLDKITPKSDKYELLDALVRSDKNTSSIKQADFFNRIYIDKDIKVKPDMRERYDGLLEVFKTENNREDEINIWISTKTQGMIKELLEKGSLTSNDNLIFANAARLKALWKIPFLGGTRLEPFTLNDGSVVHTPLMSTKQGGTFQSMVDNDLDAKVIRLPYEGDHMAMVIVMPNSVPKKGSPQPIEGLVKKLTGDKVMEVTATLENKPFCSTDVVIPRFEYEQSFELKKVLSGLRGGEVLNEDLDLMNLLEPGQPPVRVSKVFHKTRVNVYENGTLAAAASAVVNVGSSEETHCYTKFVANRPFVYFIYDYYDGKHKVVHFIGILNNPKH